MRQRWLFVLLALAAYSLPWLVNPGAALTFNAYDLAEWSSLHPAVRSASLPFVLTSGLRVLPVLLVAIIAVDSAVSVKGRVLIAVAIAIALLPPFEFFIGGWNDPNARQQFALSTITLMVGMMSVIKLRHRWWRYAQLCLILTGTITSLLALLATHALMRRFELSAQLGIGAILFTLTLIVFGVAKLNEVSRLRLPRHTESPDSNE